jgi:mRNA interferase YafQ
MTYTLRYSGQFKRSYKLCKKRGFDMSKLQEVLRLLAQDGSLPIKYRPHILSGRDWAGCWECHIEPDWLLVWEQNDGDLVLLLLDTGTHADLF